MVYGILYFLSIFNNDLLLERFETTHSIRLLLSLVFSSIFLLVSTFVIFLVRWRRTVRALTTSKLHS